MTHICLSNDLYSNNWGEIYFIFKNILKSTNTNQEKINGETVSLDFEIRFKFR